MSKQSLKKGILLVFIANLINLIINISRGFVIPKYLPVYSYAMIKKYQLYMSYVGVLHFGFIDNVYLKFGGYDIHRINNEDISKSHTNIIFIEMVLTLLLFPLAVFTKQFVLVVFVFSLMPANLNEYYKNIFQATSEFGLYSKVIYLTSFLTFGGSIILLFCFNYINYEGYIIIYFITYIFLWFYLELVTKIKFKIKYKFKTDFRDIVEGCKNGFLLMLGNFSSIMLTSMDRWFVTFLLSVDEFAYYSFAVSVENLITVFVSPIVTTFYGFLCQEKDIKKVIALKKVCMVAGLHMIALAFPVKFVLQIYLSEYVSASNVLFILFSTQAMYLVIKGIYVNIYKARGMQKIYFKQLVEIICIGFLLNAVFFFISKSIEAIALATCMSVVIWWYLCSKKLKKYSTSYKETAVYFISLICFLILGSVNNIILGFFIYIVYVTVVSVLYYRDSLIYLYNIIKVFKNKKAD